MGIILKKDLKGSKGSLITADDCVMKVIETDFKKKRYLIEFKCQSWFISFKQAKVI